MFAYKEGSWKPEANWGCEGIGDQYTAFFSINYNRFEGLSKKSQ